MIVRGVRARSEPRAHHRDADPDEEQPAGETEPRVDPFGRERARKRQRDPDQDHARRVRQRHGPGDDRGLPERATSAHHVRGHHGLAVAGSKRVHRAEDDRDPDRHDRERDRRAVRGDQGGERARQCVDAAGLPSRFGRAVGRRRRASGDDGKVGASNVQRGTEQILRVSGEPRADAVRWNARVRERRAVPDRSDLVPADVVRERRVGEREPVPAARKDAFERARHPHRREPAGAGRE